MAEKPRKKQATQVVRALSSPEMRVTRTVHLATNQQRESILSRIVSTGGLPDTTTVRRQLAFLVFEDSMSVGRRIDYAEWKARRTRHLNNVLRALKSLADAREYFEEMAVTLGDEAQNFRVLADDALDGFNTAAVPKGILQRDSHNWSAHRFDAAIYISNNVGDCVERMLAADVKELRKVPKFDAQERQLVATIWLIFLYSSKQPTLGPKGGPPSAFQRACAEIFVARSKYGQAIFEKLTDVVDDNRRPAFEARIVEHMHHKAMKERIASIVKLFPTGDASHENVGNLVFAWRHWLCGFPIDDPFDQLGGQSAPVAQMPPHDATRSCE